MLDAGANPNVGIVGDGIDNKEPLTCPCPPDPVVPFYWGGFVVVVVSIYLLIDLLICLHRFVVFLVLITFLIMISMISMVLRRWWWGLDGVGGWGKRNFTLLHESTRENIERRDAKSGEKTDEMSLTLSGWDDGAGDAVERRRRDLRGDGHRSRSDVGASSGC